MRNTWDEEFWQGASEKFSETERLFVFIGRRAEMNQNGEISSSNGERRQVCRIVWCDGFSLSQKLFTAIKKKCAFIFFFLTHRNKKWNLNTTNLPYIFTVEKFIYSSLLLPWKFVESTCFWNNAILSGKELFSSTRLFPTFGNLTVIKYKNLCESK